MLSKNKRLLIVFAAYCVLMYLLFLLVDRAILPSVTAGNATISVPSVVGQQLANAKKTMDSRELQLEVAKEIYNEKVPIGCVVTQVPPPQSIVKEGRFIYVTVSKGRELVSVPYVTGLEQRTAKINLMKSGLELGTITYAFNDGTDKDKIISQSPKGGSKISYGNQVNIVISKGSETQIKAPSLIGLSLAEATRLIEESGLSVGTISHKPDGTYLPGIISSQIPNPGEILAAGSVVDLTVAE
jgi:serine/threonine-protein kinase